MCQDHTCHECASETLDRFKSYNYTGKGFIKFYKDMGDNIASVATNRRAVKLSCRAIEQMRFDVMLTHKGIGIFLSVTSMLGIALYFVTSSDSGSIVIDCMIANGDPHPPAIQKVFWAVACGNSGCPPGSWWNGRLLCSSKCWIDVWTPIYSHHQCNVHINLEVCKGWNWGGKPRWPWVCLWNLWLHWGQAIQEHKKFSVSSFKLAILFIKNIYFGFITSGGNISSNSKKSKEKQVKDQLLLVAYPGFWFDDCIFHLQLVQHKHMVIRIVLLLMLLCNNCCTKIGTLKVEEHQRKHPRRHHRFYFPLSFYFDPNGGYFMQKVSNLWIA